MAIVVTFRKKASVLSAGVSKANFARYWLSCFAARKISFDDGGTKAWPTKKEASLANGPHGPRMPKETDWLWDEAKMDKPTNKQKYKQSRDQHC